LNLDLQALFLKIVYTLFTIQHESAAQLIFESIIGWPLLNGAGKTASESTLVFAGRGQ
jgi:hypothetical protein